MQAFSMRDFNFKSKFYCNFFICIRKFKLFQSSIFSQMHAFFLSKICNFSQKYAIFSQKICIGKCLKFSYTYKKNAITNALQFMELREQWAGDISLFFFSPFQKIYISSW